MSELTEILLKHHAKSVLEFNLNDEKHLVFDFSATNKELTPNLLADDIEFALYVKNKLKHAGAHFGIGSYLEDRIIYKRSSVFNNAKNPERTIHLGVDLFLDSSTPIFSPYKAEVHSFNDNDNYGDYGPTIILKHNLSNVEFYTLYGHLNQKSLNNLYVGKVFEAGQQIGALGSVHENVGWPPHLHFQIIKNIGNYQGDYPGVCSANDVEFFKENCPNPNHILRIYGL